MRSAGLSSVRSVASQTPSCQRRPPLRPWLALCVGGSLLAAACSAGTDEAVNTPDTVEQSVGTVAAVNDAVIETTIPGPSPTDVPPATDAPPATEAPTTTVAAEPQPSPDRERIDLRWGVQTPQASSVLDPVGAFDFGMYAVLAQTLEHLVFLDVDGVPQVSLATQWSANADSTEWTFTLRRGVTFHNGEPFSAADVVHSFERAIAAAVGGIAGTVSSGNVVALDDLTVQMTLDRPTFDWPILVSSGNPQTAIVSVGFNGPEQILNGTGAFVMQSYDAFEGATFLGNTEWWAGTPTVSRLELRFFDQFGADLTALRAGQIDGVANVSALQANTVGDDPAITFASTPAQNHRQIWMRTDTGPFEDARVRRAFALSIDREALVDTLFGNYARVANDHPISSTNPGFDSVLPQRTKNDARALELLALAGFPDGVDLTLFVPDIGEIPDLAFLVADQAVSAGFNITIDVQSSSTFYNDAWCPDLGASLPACVDNEAFGIVDYGHRVTPSIYLSRPLRSDGDWNASNLRDPVYDELEDRYANAPDPASATAALVEIQQYLALAAPVVIPYFFDWVFAHRSDLSGLRVTPLGQPRLAAARAT